MGKNDRLPLFNLAKGSSGTEESKQCNNDFLIRYMINPELNINKSFREQVDKCMNTIFGPITQPHIRPTLPPKKTRVLAILIFNGTRKILRNLWKCWVLLFIP